MTRHAGSFPFGRPSTPRPPRGVDGSASVFLLGVYPSALHVEWTPPAGTGLRRVTALAVDVEPTVFWDGSDAEGLVATWRDDVGFTTADGEVRPARLNGSSGVTVRDQVLRPMGLTFEDVWLTDAVPWFFVKSGAGQQGDVIRSVYDVFAAGTGGRRPPSTLPPRPSIASLVADARTNERTRLVDELGRSGASTIVTLGEEARRVLAGLADRVAGTPERRLTAQDDARDGSAEIAGRTYVWHALRHPGLRRRPSG